MLRRAGRYEEPLREYDGIVRDFPYDFVGSHGRATLLREVGDLEAALKAYDELMDRLPNKIFGKNSRASVLTAMGKLDEAKELLFSGSPRTYDEWVSEHIRCIILIREGRLEEAISRLDRASLSVPFARVKSYFGNATAIAFLRLDEAEKARTGMEGSRGRVSDVLSIHVFGKLGRTEEARVAYVRSEPDCPPILRELRDELARTFNVTTGTPQYDIDWIYQRECESEVLLAA